MPHQCVKCNVIYDDGAEEIMKGCTCGGKLFFFVKKEMIDEAKKSIIKLTDEEKKKIEDDVFDIIGTGVDREMPVILEFEAIKVLKPGSYELDLVNLFRNEPLIYKVEEGKYFIDIVESFDRIRKGKENKGKKR